MTATVWSGGARTPALRRSAVQACTVDFRRLLGEADWARLPPAVQARFDVTAHAEPVVYDGAMAVEASRVGWMLAQVCRLIGTPPAPWTGRDVPVSVEVRADARGGLVWGRTYSFPGRRPVLVSSTKVVDASGRLMEVVRGGLGMTLQLSVQDAALCFRSTGYFVEIAGLRAPIPGWLTPGVADVRHSDGGDGAFRFTLAFRSPVAGAHLPPGRLVPRPAGRAVTVVLTLMLLQGALGAVDTLWHHELAAGLPGRPGARAELALHAARAAIYALVFLTVGWVTWDGTWAWVLAALLLIEVGVTLQDFVLETARAGCRPASACCTR
jgi:hypothetical protein